MQVLYDYEFDYVDMHKLWGEEKYEYKMFLNKYHDVSVKSRFAFDWSILIMKFLQDFDTLDKCLHEYIVKSWFKELLYDYEF